MGPTASGKTAAAMALADRLPVELISVDSAQVFRDMDIGTAKPDRETLARYPHRLIDLISPEERYSAAKFRADALAAMADSFIANAQAAGIPMDVLHRVAAMASGGMDTLPHNGAVITVLAVTGLTHRQSYKDIFAITVIKTMAVFVVIGLFYAFGIV